MGIESTIQKLLDQLDAILRQRVVVLAEAINEVRQNARGTNRLHVGFNNFTNLSSDGLGGLRKGYERMRS